MGSKDNDAIDNKGVGDKHDSVDDELRELDDLA